MTDIKHTPGPWHVNGKQSVRGPNGEYILKTNWSNGIANAILAAAAPDLLAALEDALHGVEGNHPLDADIHSWQDAARAAIARARGEA